MNAMDARAELETIAAKQARLFGNVGREDLAQIKANNDRAAELKGWLDSHGDGDPDRFAPGMNNGRPASGKSLGRLFVESKTFKDYDPGLGQAPTSVFAGVEMKTLFDSSTGFAPQARRTGVIVPGIERRLRLFDIIDSTPTTQNAIVYMEETTTTNEAAGVAEGAASPESTLAYTQRSRGIVKVSHSLPVTDEAMADESGMENYLNVRMTEMLRLKVEAGLLTGTGTPPDLYGFLNLAGINAQAIGTDPAPDAIAKAIDLVKTVAEMEADAVVIHPNDWQPIRLLRTADGAYVFGHPASDSPAAIWGLPLIVSSGITEGTALVGAFKLGCHIFNRSEVQVSVGYVNNQFLEGEKTLRCEVRLQIAHYRPQAFTKVTGL